MRTRLAPSTPYQHNILSENKPITWPSWERYFRTPSGRVQSIPPLPLSTLTQRSPRGASPCGAPWPALRGPLGAPRGPAMAAPGALEAGAHPWASLASPARALLAVGAPATGLGLPRDQEGGMSVRVLAHAGMQAWGCESRPAPTGGLGQGVECSAHAWRQGMRVPTDGPPRRARLVIGKAPPLSPIIAKC